MALFNRHTENVQSDLTPCFDALEPRLLMSGTPFNLDAGNYVDISTGAITSEQDRPAQVAVADLNQDGYDDLVVAHRGESGNPGREISIFLAKNNGSGEFNLPQILDLWDTDNSTIDPQKPTGITIADIDGDGGLDILVGLR